MTAKQTVVRPVFTSPHSLTLMDANDQLTDLGRLVGMWGISTITQTLVDMAIAKERDFLAAAETDEDRALTLEDLAITTRELAHIAAGVEAAEEDRALSASASAGSAHRKIREAIGIESVTERAA